jgi:hypothetical protein
MLNQVLLVLEKVWFLLLKHVYANPAYQMTGF